jgi:hypothetical protein
MAVKQRIKSKNKILQNKNAKSFFEGFAFFALGFLMSVGNAVNGIQPFGISLIAVSKGKNILFSFIGSILGYLTRGLDASFARYFAGAVIALIGAIAASAFELYERPSFPITIAFLASFASGFIMDFKLQSIYTAYIVTLGEALLCCGGAFFLFKATNCAFKRIRLGALPFYDLCCIMISFSIVLMNLSYFSFWGVCPARALAAAALLIMLRLSNTKLGLVFAISSGFAFSIAEKGDLFILGALAFSFLVSSVFFDYSPLASGIAFLCSVGFFCISSGSAIALSFFIEAAVGVLIFLLAPSKLNRKIESLGEKSVPSDSSLRQSLVLKLRFASSAMASISESVEQVREKINEIARNESETNRLNMSREEFINKEIILEKTNQIRMVASDQFFSIADMLEELAFEYDEAETFDSAACEKIRALLGEYGIYPKNVSVIEDKFSRMRVEILSDAPLKKLENPEFQEEIGKICSRYFERGRITSFKEENMLSFFERPSYRLSVGFAQHSAEGSLCGDTVKIINDYKGHCILIISDGMGKGSRAALDGAMGAGLIAKLINAGFGFNSALKIVNCALLVKSNDESLATLDIASIDLFTGKCEFFKAGAPASYIIKNRAVSKCELSSMPAGILRGVEFAKKSAVLSPGDCLALMSDGICDLGEEWLEEILLSNNDYTPPQKADLILDEAIKKSQENKTDDMSIIYAKLERN